MPALTDHRAILETIRDAIVVADARGVIVFVNAAAERMLGYPSGALAGRPIASLLPERLRTPDLVGAGLPRGAGSEPSAIDVTRVTMCTARGDEIPVEVRVDPARIDGGPAAVWLVRSAHERVALENRLAIRDALTAMADAFVQMTANPDVDRVARVVVEALVGRLGGVAARIWLWDRARKRLYLQAWAGLGIAVDRAEGVAQGGAAAYGLGLAEVAASLQARVVAAVDPTDATLPAWLRGEAIAGYALFPLAFGDQLVGVAAYFSRAHISDEMLQLLVALARHAGVALHDVAEQVQARRQIEALAREAHARSGEFAAIVSNMPDAVFVARDGRIAFANRTAVQMLGADDAAELYVPTAEFGAVANVRDAAGNSVPAEQLVVARVLEGEVITGREERMTNRRTGREVWVQVSGAPLRDPSGRVQGGVVVAAEITRLKELEHSKDEWLAIAAHELRTPLTPITVHLQMAQRRLHMGRPLEPEVFDKALEQVKRLARLVNGLLDVTRLQAGQLDLVLEDVDVRELVEAIVDRVRHGAPRHTLVVDVDSRPVLVHGDRTRLDEVISALVDNAIKYSPDGGEVWVSAHTRGGESVVEVRDQGLGIPPEERARIFERYFRSGSVPQMQYGGLGLGLWIAGKVVQKHGGRIELDSTPGVGSTFSVHLPVGGEARASAAPTLKTRVLVVDDDAAVLEAITGLLAEDGYEVRMARSGPEALDVARAWLPHAVLLDLRMPGMDGWEVRRRFAADPLLAKVPIVLVSADRDARARAAGMDVQGFVAKPFDVDEIERVLNALVVPPAAHADAAR